MLVNRKLFAVGALVLLGGLAGCSASGTSRAGQSLATPSPLRTAAVPQVVADCQHFALRPAQIGVACGDGNYQLVEARYDHWGADRAVGSAVALTNTCQPNCAQGRFVRVPVRFTLDQERLVYGVALFTRLTVLDARTGRPVLTAPLLPLDCSVEPPSCPPSPAP